jgi:ankyrin repeat protein
VLIFRRITMLEGGADVNVRNKYGKTPLHYAAKSGTPENITALLEAGADVNARDMDGWTPLYYAAEFGTPENITALLEVGADVNARDEGGKNPFDFAEDNPNVKGTGAYWKMNDARYNS